MAFMGDVGSTLTKGMWEDKTVRAKKKIAIMISSETLSSSRIL
jgi:hypothetical protein